MRVGFFLVLRSDPQHFLHAAALVREAGRWMPGVEIVQLSDTLTPAVPGVTCVERRASTAPLLDQRLTHYAQARGEWLLIDTDVSIRNAVAGVFDDPVFDVALCDRDWPHLREESARLSLTMPFNTGVVFSRAASFWGDVLDRWRSLPAAVQADWMSEQRAVYDVVRTGRHRVKVLPGQFYNYPPREAGDPAPLAALVHYKGPRKAWLSAHATRVLGGV